MSVLITENSEESVVSEEEKNDYLMEKDTFEGHSGAPPSN
jgi:hypothetical protein